MITKGDWTIEYGFIKEDDVCISNDGFALIAQLHNEDDAEFIVSVCNACKEINPEHPELVAETIAEMHDVLTAIVETLAGLTKLQSDICYWCGKKIHQTDCAYNQAYAILSKIKGGE